MSQIYGGLSANGKVYLVNPNGVIIGESGVINTAGFLATTHSINNVDFMGGGNLTLRPGNVAEGASVVNLGSISVNNDDVFLIADHVVNEGEIIVTDGDVGLAAARGSEVLLSDSGQQRLLVKPSTSAETGKDGVINKGTIEAVNAEIKAAGGNVYALAIKNSGKLRATGVQRNGGRILLTSKGGDIAVENGSEITANGELRGGQIAIGCSPELQCPLTDKARSVTIEEGATLQADATNNEPITLVGDVDVSGGRVVVHGDDKVERRSDRTAIGRHLDHRSDHRESQRRNQQG